MRHPLASDPLLPRALAAIAAVCLVLASCSSENGEEVNDLEPPEPAPVIPEPWPETVWASAQRAYYELVGPAPHCQWPEGAPERAGAVEVIWERAVASTPSHRPSAIVGDYYFHVNDATPLYQMDRFTGEPVAVVRGYPSGGTWLEAGGDGLLYMYRPGVMAIDPESLAGLRWLEQVGVEAYGQAPVVLEDGRMLVAGWHGHLYFLEPSGRGYEVIWTRRFGHRVEGPIAHDPDRGVAYLLVTISQGEDKGDWTVAVRVEDGELMWRKHRSSGYPVLLSEDRVVASAFSEETRDTVLLARDRGTGRVVATAFLYSKDERAGGGYYVVGDERVYVAGTRPHTDIWADETGEISALDTMLTPLWRKRLPRHQEDPDNQWWGGSSPWAEVVDLDGNIVVALSNCYVYALDPDGKVLWWDRLPYSRTTSLIRSEDGLIYVVSTNDPPPDVLEERDGYKHFISLIRAYRPLPDYDGPDPCDVGVPCPTLVESWPPPDDDGGD